MFAMIYFACVSDSVVEVDYTPEKKISILTPVAGEVCSYNDSIEIRLVINDFHYQNLEFEFNSKKINPLLVSAKNIAETNTQIYSLFYKIPIKDSLKCTGDYLLKIFDKEEVNVRDSVKGFVSINSPFYEAFKNSAYTSLWKESVGWEYDNSKSHTLDNSGLIYTTGKNSVLKFPLLKVSAGDNLYFWIKGERANLPTEIAVIINKKDTLLLINQLDSLWTRYSYSLEEYQNKLVSLEISKKDNKNSVIYLDDCEIALNSFVNNPPITIDDKYSTLSNEELQVDAENGVLKNDYDYDLNQTILEAYLFKDPNHGFVELKSNGSFEYFPSENFAGVDSFFYRAFDQYDYSALEKVVIEVKAGNSPPLAGNDSYAVISGETLNISQANGVLKNDSDEDGDKLSVQLVSTAAHGELDLKPTGSFSYTPNSGYVGADSFIYRAFDGEDYSENATVVIAINSGNSVPVAHNDFFQVIAGETLNVSDQEGILKNDTDLDSDPLRALLITDITQGFLVLNPEGGFSFTAPEEATGNASFTYRAFDGKDSSNAANVTITILPENIPPVAENDSYFAKQNELLVISSNNGVLANDNDENSEELTAHLATDVAYGNLILNSDGSFSYEPNPNFLGEDSFVYKAFDGISYSNPAIVRIKVNYNNTKPLAVADNYQTIIEELLEVGEEEGVLANDSDNENNELIAINVTNTIHGTLNFNINGSFSYLADNGFMGTDSFSYFANDGQLNSDTVQVYLEVVPANILPVAVSDTFSVADNTNLVVTAENSFLNNDLNEDNDSLEVIFTGEVQHGEFFYGGDGCFTYVPETDFIGLDSLKYKLFDGKDYSNEEATILIDVFFYNRPPKANNDNYYTYQDTGINISVIQGLLANDYDLDEDELSCVLVAQPENGSLVLNENGSFIYVPNYDFLGVDHFEYKVTDGYQYSNVANVYITVVAP